MEGLYKNKYRIASARLPDRDYGQNGWYFVTVCTEGRRIRFGNVVRGEMALNGLGKMADAFWREIPTHFPFVIPDEYIVMPNHVHGIVHIERNDGDARRDAIHRVSTHVKTGTIYPFSTHVKIGKDAMDMENGKGDTMNGEGDAMNRVSTGGVTGEHNPMGKNNLGEILRWYKGRCKYESKPFDPDFQWQSRFYDKIIRNDEILDKIRFYIANNPARWELDRNNLGIWM